MLLYNQEAQDPKSTVYIPPAEVGQEIVLRLDMKDGCVKLGEHQLLDENQNGIVMRGYLLGYQNHFGDIGMYSDTFWVKLLFIPLINHPNLNFKKRTVCSIWCRGDSKKNFTSAVSMAPVQEISINRSITEIKFNKVDKTTQDGQKVQTRPATFSFIKPTPQEVESIKNILNDLETKRFNVETENNNLPPEKQKKTPDFYLQSLLEFTSGNQLIPLTGDNDQGKINAFKDSKTMSIPPAQYALPSSVDLVPNTNGFADF